MNLTPEQQDIVRKQFGYYCIKVLHGEALNYLNELKKHQEREINFSELAQSEINQLYVVCDDILDTNLFHVMDVDVAVKNDSISDALNQLPEKKRMIILMAYFLDMTEKEIADYLHLVQSTVHYHKAESLRLLRNILE